MSFKGANPQEYANPEINHKHIKTTMHVLQSFFAAFTMANPIFKGYCCPLKNTKVRKQYLPLQQTYQIHFQRSNGATITTSEVATT